VWWVVAAGYCNHAGAGGWKGLSGNGSVIGVEAENDGIGEPWPQVQLDSYTRGVAAVCEHKDWPAGMVCGHKEWTPQKIDPAGVDMDWFRSEVARHLDREAEDMLATATNQAGQLEQFWLPAGDRQVRNSWPQPSSPTGWTGWQTSLPLLPEPVDGLSAGRDSDGKLKVVAVTKSGTRYICWQAVSKTGWNTAWAVV
jgi:hypothetical protein